MYRVTSLFRWTAFALIILLLIALAWWYFFLRAREASLAAADAGRGRAGSAPTFSGSTGSTYSNVAQSFAGETGGGGQVAGTPPRLWEVSAAPSAGMGFTGSGASTRLRFVERSSGYVLEADPATGSLVRLTNTLVPRVYEALIAPDGNVIERTVDDAGAATTLYGVVTPAPAASSSPDTLVITQLPGGIRSVVFSGTGRQVAYIAPGGNGGTVLMRAELGGTSAQGGKLTQLLSSGMAGWRLAWLRDGRIILAQAASDGVLGYAYTVEAGGALTPLARAALGLTVLAQASSSALVFGQTNEGSLLLFGQVDQKSTPVPLPIRTVADKCVWGPGKSLVAYCAVPRQAPGPGYLDRWYRGEVHTADAWWQVDVSAGSATALAAPDANTPLDVENPMMDADGNYIAFLNAADKSLWLLRVAQ